MTAVVNVYARGYLKRAEVWSTVLQAREEFGFRVLIGSLALERFSNECATWMKL